MNLSNGSSDRIDLLCSPSRV